MRWMPPPQIRCNLTPCQATGERNANRIPLELSSLCIAAIFGRLDGEYRSQKTGTEPVQVHIGRE